MSWRRISNQESNSNFDQLLCRKTPLLRWVPCSWSYLNRLHSIQNIKPNAIVFTLVQFSVAQKSPPLWWVPISWIKLNSQSTDNCNYQSAQLKKQKRRKQEKKRKILVNCGGWVARKIFIIVCCLYLASLNPYTRLWFSQAEVGWVKKWRNL